MQLARRARASFRNLTVVLGRWRPGGARDSGRRRLTPFGTVGWCRLARAVSPPRCRTGERDLIGPCRLPRVTPVRSPVASSWLEEAIWMTVVGVDVHEQSLTAVGSTRPG